MNFEKLFDADLVFLDRQIENREQMFQEFSDIFIKSRLVKESFKENIIQREEEYPTGIQTETIGVALPHTDPENILKPFVAVIRPQKAVKFNPMGMAENEVEASLIFILGVKNDGGQVKLLQGLMNLLMKDEVVHSLMKETNEEKIIKIILENIGG